MKLNKIVANSIKTIFFATLAFTTTNVVSSNLSTATQSTASIVKLPIKYEQPAPIKNRPEQIIAHTGYILSFNSATLQPNWVAWDLKASETNGSSVRYNKFSPDPLLPIAQRVVTRDYASTGYDRGHMCPAADMHWSSKAMVDCFYLSNICPQNPSLNRISWASLEKACRKWAKTEGTIYITCGPVFKSKSITTIGHSHKIAIPDGFFKVILSLRKGHEKAIGFYYNNTATKQQYTTTCTTVDAIEKITGYDFFTKLPNTLEAKLESHCNISAWQ